MEAITEITDNDFPEIMNTEAAVLIIFTSPDCGYCHLLKENVREAVQQISGIDLYQCRIDLAPEAVRRLKVKSIPQYKVFRQGEVIYTGLGVPRTGDIYYQLKSLNN